MAEETKQKHQRKPVSFKFLLTIFLLIILIGLSLFAYVWFRQTSEKIQKAETVLGQVALYEALSKNIQDEYSRCQVFVSQEQGDFGEFQYCQGFIRWVNGMKN